MAGLMDIFGADPRAQGLMAAAAAMLQASGPSRRPTTFGQVMGSGLMAGQEATQQATQQEQLGQMRGLQIKGAESDLAAQQRARDEELLFAGMAKNFIKTPGQQAATLPGGPTADNAARIPGMSTDFDMNGYIDAMMVKNPLKALELKRSMAKAAPKFDSGITFVNGPDGKPMAVRTADDGSIKQIDGMSPREKLELENLGGRSVAVNPYELQAGQSFQRSATPDALISAQTQIRGQNMTDARQRDANTNSRGLMNEERQLRIDALRGKADERQLSKQGTMSNLLTQVSVIDKALAHPGRTTSTGASGVIDPRNYLPGTDATDFRVVADQLSGGAFLQAFESLKGAGQITEIEGQKATQAIARLNRAQSDSEYQTALLDLRGVINSGVERMGGKPAPLPEAYAAAAAKQGAAPRKSAIKGQILDGHRFKGGNPADPNAWEKL